MSQREWPADVYADSGFTGAHFDIMGGQSLYHTPRHNIVSLDLPSLQMQGNAMLAVVRHFGNRQLEPTSSEDMTMLTPSG